jgi:hypothetical protein
MGLAANGMIESHRHALAAWALAISDAQNELQRLRRYKLRATGTVLHSLSRETFAKISIVELSAGAHQVLLNCKLVLGFHPNQYRTCHGSGH